MVTVVAVLLSVAAHRWSATALFRVLSLLIMVLWGSEGAISATLGSHGRLLVVTVSCVVLPLLMMVVIILVAVVVRVGWRGPFV